MEGPAKSFHKFNEALISSEKGREVFAGFFRSKNGIEKIYYKRDQPSKSSYSPKIHIFAVHDMGQYHGSYNSLKNFLVKKFSNDIAVTTIDLKGHGLSSGTRAFVNDFKEYKDDVLSLLERENYGANWSHEPLKILLGQGMGALICLHVLSSLSLTGKSSNIQGAVLSNPLLKLKYQSPQYVSFALKGWRRRLGGPALGRVRLPIQLGSAREGHADPLVLKQVTISLLSGLLKTGEELKNSSYFIELPLFFLLGEKSEFCDVERATLFHKGILKKYSHCQKYPSYGHDIFNNKGCDKALNDLHHWLRGLLN